ncbi:cytochrome P450 [Sphingomonas crocodyli]|uniref:Cytochrome P450 n=1 Tax=Sphingomonas crocodyli TaxID=1979270 RepID=A0A437M0G7_9SPHN|nr:cytochrome P450 [Sphingomonas crocodyli]RVT91075.1 cytochrome P450 [Sphingomonas crocodyli]
MAEGLSADEPFEDGAEFRYDPFSIEAMTDPTVFYPTLRDHYPAYYLPQYDAWAISRFADVWDGFLDSENFTEAEGQIFDQRRLLIHNDGVVPQPVIEPTVDIFNHIDGALHTRFRQTLAPPFLKGNVAKLAPQIEKLTRDRIVELRDRGRFDINADFASHVAAGSMCLILGIPLDRVPDIIRLVNLGVAREPGKPGFTKKGGEAIGQLHAMLVEIIARRRAGGGEPNRTLDALLSADLVGRPLSDGEIARQMSTLLVGGSETLPKIVSGGLLELSRRPDQLAEIREDVETRAPQAFEEVLRFNAPAQWFGRTVKHDRDLAGVRLRAGQRVILLIAAANRDRREFDRPDEFIWHRKARRLLSFGIGPHFCIGIHVARLEGQIMLREFLHAFPRFTVDPAAGEFAVSEFQMGWTSLPAEIQ